MSLPLKAWFARYGQINTRTGTGLRFKSNDRALARRRLLAHGGLVAIDEDKTSGKYSTFAVRITTGLGTFERSKAVRELNV
jgi:hypothetical protein